MASRDARRPPVLDLLVDLADSPRVHPDVARAIRTLEDLSTGQHPETRLSVLVLLTRDRQEALKDTLLCLHAQSVPVFEILLVRHALPTEELDEIDRIIADQPAEVGSIIRVVDPAGDTRASSMNVAADVARGSHVVACEAGDLLLATWASSMVDAADGSTAHVVHAIGAVQTVVPVLWPTDEQGHHAVSDRVVDKRQAYDAREHLRRRQSPPATWAVPRWLFDLGLGFAGENSPHDEWELIHRASNLAGVHEAGMVTSVSRTWLTARTWEADVSADETAAAPDDVVQRLARLPLLVTPDSAVAASVPTGRPDVPRPGPRRGSGLRRAKARVARHTWQRWRR